MIEHFNGDRLDTSLTDEITVVDFYAAWCGPCKMLSMELENLKGTRILKVDIDKNRDLAVKHGVMSIPTVEIYKNKQKVASFIGYKSKEEIEKMLRSI